MISNLAPVGPWADGRVPRLIVDHSLCLPAHRPIGWQPGQSGPVSTGKLPLLAQSCAGPFFKAPPMKLFGGTALAYAAVFNLTEVLNWVGERFPDKEDRVWHFQHMTAAHDPGGLSVLQAVVVNGAMDAYDTLIKVGGPCRVDVMATRPTGNALTPLRLAAKVGHAKMFEHILSTRKAMQWKWGPVTSYTVPLDEIDTFGRAGRQQVLEILVEQGAAEQTKNMLTDKCLNGLLFTLIRHKWLRWARALYMCFYLPPRLAYTT